MNETTCPECGERNVGAPEFCASCGAFLAWQATNIGPLPPGALQGPPAAAAGPAMPPPGAVAGPAAAGPTAPPPAPVAAPPVRSGGDPVGPGWAAPTHPSGFAQVPTAAVPTAAVPTTAVPAGAPGARGATGGWPTAPTAAPPPPPPPPPPPTDQACPRCGVENDLALRFCRKCGYAFAGPTLTDAGASVAATAEKLPWWRRWFKPTPGTTRAARAAFRASMSWRYRAMRWVWVLLGLGAITGSLYLLGQNPVRWVSDRWQDLRGSVAQVEGVQAVSEPSEGAVPEFPATFLTDNLADTAWATSWTATDAATAASRSCLPPGSPSPQGIPASAVLIPAEPVEVRSLSIAAGLGEGDGRRPSQWRPKTLELAFSDGTCQRVSLADSPALQDLQIEPVETTQIRVSVVDVYPPVSDQPVDLTSISEIQLFARP